MSLQLPTVVFVSKTREEYERYCLACDIRGFEVGDYFIDCRCKPANPQKRTPNCLVMNTFDSRDNLAIVDKRIDESTITEFCVDIAAAIKRLFAKVDNTEPYDVVNVFVHWGGGSAEEISNLENKLNKILDTIPIFEKWRIISLSSLRPGLINVGNDRINLPSTADEFTNLIVKGVMGCSYKDQLTAYICNSKKNHRLQNSGKWLPWLLGILEDEIKCGANPDSRWMLKVIDGIKKVEDESLKYDERYAALFSHLLQMGLL